MKAVILLAGKGRRIQKTFGPIHKSLILLNGNTLLSYVISNVQKAGITSVVPVLGYQKNTVLAEIERCKGNMEIIPAENEEYENTNNLVSLLKAEESLDGEDFLLINGDMVFDYRILLQMQGYKNGAIAVDVKDYPVQIDSPRVQIQNDRITDLGRHMSRVDAQGYAVGIYYFSRELSRSFFEYTRSIIKDNLQMGFHDPLRQLFGTHLIQPVSVGDYCWMDVDEKSDIVRAEQMLLKIQEMQDEKF